ncbi:glycosyltransferase [Paenibacillus sp. DYY-L-2]|uniref:glycosyltransferase n=1 Tax=Paenibacillus sp. DYY-L-2 TaxID=3447013 RepID=UPI003F50C602
MRKNSISLCMIVKDEERFLERCLLSTKGIVDEIIIVDTGSTDRTIDIAKAYEAKVFHFEWKNDFAKARNESLIHATGEYILVLDADEYIDKEHGPLLEPLSEDAYFLSIKSVLKGGVSTIHSAIRLFKNCPEFRFTGRIHEQIIVPIDEGYTQSPLAVLVHHDGYLRDVINEKKKEQRNLDLLLADLKEKETGFGLFNLGIQYKMMGEYEKAITMLEKAFPLSTQYSYISKLITSLIQCYMELEQYNSALIICNEAISVYENYTDLYYLKGQIYDSINYWNDASNSFEKCLRLGEVKDSEMMTFHGVGSYMALTSLAGLHHKKGNIQEAIKSIISALRINKHYMPAVKLMIDLTKGSSVEDAFEFITKTWKIETLDDLKEMIGVLYKLRNPLLYKFSEMYQHNVDDNIKSIGFLYSGRYQEAADYWNRDSYEYDDEQMEDILLCAIIQEKTLISKYKSNFSIREKDIKILQRISERSEIKEHKLSKDASKLIANLFEKLIILKEFDLIDYFVTSVRNYDVQFAFAQHLYNYGFKEISMQIMEGHLDRVDREGLVWIAHCLMKDGNDNESLRFFDEALKRSVSFDVLEKCYELLSRNHNLIEAREVSRMMKELTPVSEWAKGL